MCMLRSDFPLPGTKSSEPWMLPKPFLFNHYVAFRLMHGQKGSFREQTANVASSRRVHSSLTAPKRATMRTRRCHHWLVSTQGEDNALSRAPPPFPSSTFSHQSSPSLPWHPDCTFWCTFIRFPPRWSKLFTSRYAQRPAKGSLCSAPARSWCFTFL